MAKPYVRNTWVNGAAPAINEDNLNNVEDGTQVNNRQDLSTTHNVTSDANRTLTISENQFGRIEETDTGILLTATREIIMNNDEHTFLFVNSTAQSLTVKTSAGTGITVIAGASVELRNDTVNVIEFEAGSSYGDTEVLSLFNASGSAPVVAPRTYLNYNGVTNATRAQINVSSVTDLGTGNYQVNLSVAMPTNTYTVLSGCSRFNTSLNGAIAVVNPYDYTTSNFKIETFRSESPKNDIENINLAIIG